MQRVKRPSAAKARLSRWRRCAKPMKKPDSCSACRRRAPAIAPPGPWEAFAKAGIVPDLGAVHFVARAITPPKRPLRFDSRFFAADVSAIARREDGFVGPDKELVELVWLPITEARQLDMPGITAVVLEELQDRIKTGMSHDHPVPLYRMLHKRFVREIL